MGAKGQTVYRLWSGQTIESSGTITSDSFDVSRAEYASLKYELSTATSGGYVTGSISILVAPNKDVTFTRFTDSQKTDLSLLYTLTNINAAFSVDIPTTKYAQIQIASGTNNNITFANVWFTVDEN